MPKQKEAHAHVLCTQNPHTVFGNKNKKSKGAASATGLVRASIDRPIDCGGEREGKDDSHHTV